MIRFDTLRFGYGDKKIFDGLSLTLEPLTIFTGPSGCGKTTLLRLIAGLEKPQGGAITGVPARVSMLFQEDRLLPWLTAERNIAAVLPPGNAGAAGEWIKRVELADCPGELPENLSGGQKRRVALARALAYAGALPAGESLLILDEPFKGFDAALTKRMAALILELKIPVAAAIHAAGEMALLGGEIVRL